MVIVYYLSRHVLSNIKYILHVAAALHLNTSEIMADTG